MRLLSYNILDGGEGRADPLAETVLAQKCDLVALIEADYPPVTQRIARRLGMEFVVAEGRKHSVALLSRWPIVESFNHALLRGGLKNCCMEATVRDPGGREWTLGLVHLHPRAHMEDDRVRQGEVEVICDIFKNRRDPGRPHILCGDFNSDSPVQEIEPGRCKPATQKAWTANGGHLPRGAVTKILAAGYVDTLHALHPAVASRTGSFTTQFSGQRVDYVFTFGYGDRVKGAWIEQDRLAKYASDHFPVGVEIE